MQGNHPKTHIGTKARFTSCGTVVYKSRVMINYSVYGWMLLILAICNNLTSMQEIHQRHRVEAERRLFEMLPDTRLPLDFEIADTKVVEGTQVTTRSANGQTIQIGQYPHSARTSGQSSESVASKLRIYYDSVTVRLLDISDEQLTKIEEEIKIADQYYQQQSTGLQENDREIYRMILSSCSLKLDELLTREQLQAFQNVRVAWNLAGFSIHLLRDPEFRSEFVLSPEQDSKIDDLFVEIVTSALEKVSDHEIESRRLEKQGNGSLVLLLREHFRHQEDAIRERVQSLLSAEQSKRLLQLEIQNVVVAKGVVAFAISPVKFELQLTTSQEIALRNFDSVKANWTTTAKRVEEFRHFEEKLSRVQLAKWRDLVGAVHESFNDWPCYELLKNTP